MSCNVTFIKFVKIKMQENLKTFKHTHAYVVQGGGKHFFFFSYLDGGDVLDSEISNFYVCQIPNKQPVIIMIACNTVVYSILIFSN